MLHQIAGFFVLRTMLTARPPSCTAAIADVAGVKLRATGLNPGFGTPGEVHETVNEEPLPVISDAAEAPGAVSPPAVTARATPQQAASTRALRADLDRCTFTSSSGTTDPGRYPTSSPRTR